MPGIDRTLGFRTLGTIRCFLNQHCFGSLTYPLMWSLLDRNLIKRLDPFRALCASLPYCYQAVVTDEGPNPSRRQLPKASVVLTRVGHWPYRKAPTAIFPQNPVFATTPTPSAPLSSTPHFNMILSGRGLESWPALFRPWFHFGHTL
jgi:hypothetical protein